MAVGALVAAGLGTGIEAGADVAGRADPGMGFGADAAAGAGAEPAAATRSSWTTMTLPQVLHRMRRIFCLTFSSAIE
jgi:hypothetical protein